MPLRYPDNTPKQFWNSVVFAPSPFIVGFYGDNLMTPVSKLSTMNMRRNALS